MLFDLLFLFCCWHFFDDSATLNLMAPPEKRVKSRKSSRQFRRTLMANRRSTTWSATPTQDRPSGSHPRVSEFIWLGSPTRADSSPKAITYLSLRSTFTRCPSHPPCPTNALALAINFNLNQIEFLAADVVFVCLKSFVSPCALTAVDVIRCWRNRLHRLLSEQLAQ